MTVYRVLIVDDETPAREKLKRLLTDVNDFRVAGEAGDGPTAVAAIRDLVPDLVLLDIQMPGMDGFQVVGEIGVDAMPLVVFVTAFDEHALKAFEVHALDYLLKPFAPSRLHNVLERVRQRLEKDAAADLAQRLENVLGAVAPATTLTTAEKQEFVRRIRARRQEDRDREVLLAVGDIHFIRSQANYLHFHTNDGVFQRRGTLSALLERLDPEHFARINRSEIVRLDAIQELQPFYHGDTYVILRGGTRLTWSRRFRDGMPDL